MVHGAVLSLAISDEGQSIDKKANCSTFIYTRKRRTPQSLTVTVLVQWFTENYYMLREKWNSVALSRNLKAINLFITSRRNQQRETDRQTDIETKTVIGRDSQIWI